MTPDDIRFFDPVDDYAVSWNKLPHWSQSGTVVFVTYRTADSIPADVYRQFMSERNAVLQSQGLDPFSEWQSALAALPRSDSLRIKWKLIERFDGRLNECHGACVLQQPEVSKLVADSLLKFDRDRYILTDYIVMPNHIHLLAAFNVRRNYETAGYGVEALAGTTSQCVARYFGSVLAGLRLRPPGPQRRAIRILPALHR
jgi:hypothetical protein